MKAKRLPPFVLAAVLLAFAVMPSAQAGPLAPPEQTQTLYSDMPALTQADTSAPGDATPAGVISAASPADTSAPVSAPLHCSTAKELGELLAQDAGGVITLTGNIVFDGDYDIAVTQPVTVSMGSFGISISSAANVGLSGPVRFEGTGCPVPLFLAQGMLRTGSGVEIAASGDNAVAVEIIPGPSEARTGFWSPQFTSVSAAGKDAVAVISHDEDATSIEYSRVEARGENATGIRARSNIRLTACEVLADGEAVVSETGEIVLDASRIIPMPSRANVISRRVEPRNRIAQNGISVAATSLPPHEAMEEYDEFDGGLGFNLIDTDGSESAAAFLTDAAWGNIPSDWSVPGSNLITYIPVGVPDWLPLQGIEPFDIPFHIVGENQPHIRDAYRMGPDGVLMRFFSEIKDAQSIVLWTSPDGGASWLDVTEINGSMVSPFNALIEKLDANRDYLFRLEVTGGPMEGFSNTLLFPYYDIDADREGGGDRDDTNRGEQDKPPKTGGIVPSPDKPESGGDSSDWDEDYTEEPVDERETQAPVFVETADAGTPEQEAAMSLTQSSLAAQLKAYPQGLTVTGQGIKAVFPARLLESIELGEGEDFSVLLEYPAPDRFLIRLLAGSREITGFRDERFFVHVAYDASDKELPYIRCENEAGVSAPADRYEDNRFVFGLSSTGEYLIVEDFPAAANLAAAPERRDTEAPANAAPKKKPRSPLVPALTLGTALLTAGAAAAYRLRLGKGTL